MFYSTLVNNVFKKQAFVPKFCCWLQTFSLLIKTLRWFSTLYLTECLSTSYPHTGSLYGYKLSPHRQSLWVQVIPAQAVSMGTSYPRTGSLYGYKLSPHSPSLATHSHKQMHKNGVPYVRLDYTLFAHNWFKRSKDMKLLRSLHSMRNSNTTDFPHHSSQCLNWRSYQHIVMSIY